MAELQPKDKVEWRAGETPSSSHLRKGVIKEVLPGGIALVRTKVEGASVLEEIRMARLRKVEQPKPAKVKKGKKTKKAGARRKSKGAKSAKK
jgi:hypothetical protein